LKYFKVVETLLTEYITNVSLSAQKLVIIYKLLFVRQCSFLFTNCIYS